MSLWMKLFPPRTAAVERPMELNREEEISDAELWERVMEGTAALALARRERNAASMCDETSGVVPAVDSNGTHGAETGEEDDGLAIAGFRGAR